VTSTPWLSRSPSLSGCNVFAEPTPDSAAALVLIALLRTATRRPTVRHQPKAACKPPQPSCPLSQLPPFGQAAAFCAEGACGTAPTAPAPLPVRRNSNGRLGGPIRAGPSGLCRDAGRLVGASLARANQTGPSDQSGRRRTCIPSAVLRCVHEGAGITVHAIFQDVEWSTRVGHSTA
jgi:hypothetical protein